jgi:hypothetical protein
VWNGNSEQRGFGVPNCLRYAIKKPALSIKTGLKLAAHVPPTDFLRNAN